MLTWYVGRQRTFPWRRDAATQYERVVAELLLQRTRAETVRAFLPAFLRRFPSWRALAAADESEIAAFLRPIGLWRRRANVLKRLSLALAATNGRFPQERASIQELPGVGQYVANSVLLFCHGSRQPLLDASMARVLERYFGPRRLADIRYDPYLQQLAWRVVQTDDAPSLNWAILDFAALVCLPKPRCQTCILRRGCSWRKAQRGNERRPEL